MQLDFALEILKIDKGETLELEMKKIKAIENKAITSNQTPIEVLLAVDENGKTSARSVYTFLNLNPAHYARWCKTNITDNIFTDEGKDYSPSMVSEQSRGNFAQDYDLSASFAKRLCMTSKTERGEVARNYFIKVEQMLVNEKSKQQRTHLIEKGVELEAVHVYDGDTTIYQHENYGKVMLVDLDGEKWLKAIDVVRAMGYVGNPANVFRGRWENLQFDTRVYQIHTRYGAQMFKLVNRELFEELIDDFKPHCPDRAERVRGVVNWILRDVLPLVPQQATKPKQESIARDDKLNHLENEIADLKRRLDASPHIIPVQPVEDKLYSATEIGESYGLGGRMVYIILENNGIIFYKKRKPTLYAKYREKGYVKRHSGHNYWTEKGKAFVEMALEGEGYAR